MLLRRMEALLDRFPCSRFCCRRRAVLLILFACLNGAYSFTKLHFIVFAFEYEQFVAS